MESASQLRPDTAGIMVACQRGDLPQLGHLLIAPEAVRLVKQKDKNGRGVLHVCSENARLEAAELLIAYMLEHYGASELSILLDAQDSEGFTALLIATINGHLPMLQLLISRGANINLFDRENHTAVHWAVVCGQLDCLEELLRWGAEASSPDIHGAYPLHYAAQMSSKNHGQDPEGFFGPRRPSLAGTGLPLLQKLIEAGVAIDALDLDKRSPMLWAASSGATMACVALSKAGSDVNLGDKDGLTALICAASRGHLECLGILLSECKAAVDIADRHECTALMYAATLGFTPCVSRLAKNGAEKDHQDRKGRSAAHLAASKGQTECLLELEELGGNIWHRNLRGDMPLHEAAQAGLISVMEMLLTRRPDAINAVNRDGRSCLHISAMTRDLPLCQFLVENGIHVNLVMQNSKRQYFTALDLATARNNEEMVKFLRLHGATDANRLTKTSAMRIQRSFLRQRGSRRGSLGSTTSGFGITEEPTDAASERAESRSAIPDHVHDDIPESPKRSSGGENSSPTTETPPPRTKLNSISFSTTMRRPSLLNPPLAPMRQFSTPVFEMSSLSLMEMDSRRTQSARPAVKYESDSDDDMKHPSLKPKFHPFDDGHDSDPEMPFSVPSLGLTEDDALMAVSARNHRDRTDSLTPRPTPLLAHTAVQANDNAWNVDQLVLQEGSSQTEAATPRDTNQESPRNQNNVNSSNSTRKGRKKSTIAEQEDKAVSAREPNPFETAFRLKQMKDTASSALDLHALPSSLSRNEGHPTPRAKETRDSAVSARPLPDEPPYDLRKSSSGASGISDDSPVGAGRLETISSTECTRNAVAGAAQPTAKLKRARMRWDQAGPDSSVDADEASAPGMPADPSRAGFTVPELTRRPSRVSFSTRRTSLGPASRQPSINDDQPEEPQPAQAVDEPEPADTVGEEKHTELYTRFRPPTPRVPTLHEIARTTKPLPEQSAKARLPKALTSQPARSTQYRPQPKRPNPSSKDVNAPTIDSTQFPPISSKFLNSFQNTLYELGPQTVIVRYLDSLAAMRKKDTKYNEAVVLDKVLPKFAKDLRSVGTDPNRSGSGSSQSSKSKASFKDIKSFDEWERYLLDLWRTVQNNSTTNSFAGSKTSESLTASLGLSREISSLSTSSNRSPTFGETHSKLPQAEKPARGSDVTTKSSIKKRMDSGDSLTSKGSVGSNQAQVNRSRQDATVSPAKASPVLELRHPFPWR